TGGTAARHDLRAGDHRRSEGPPHGSRPLPPLRLRPAVRRPARPGSPPPAQIATVLRRAAEAEEIQLPDAACALIARRAGGSFRDALGDLEQIVTYSGRRIGLEAVLAVLNLPDADMLFEAACAVAGADPAGALRAVARMCDSG